MINPNRDGGLLFDLDGTLIDTAPDFINVVNQLLLENNQPPLPEDAIRSQVSNGSSALVNLAFNYPPDDCRHAPMRERLLAIYSQRLAEKSYLFPGLEFLLNEIEARGIPWGIVTNKPSLYAMPLIEKLGLSSRCQSLICPDHVKQRKPHPEALLKACDQMRICAKDSVYVGDHERDIQAGRQAEMTTVAALYGYILPEDNPSQWQADHYVNTPDDLSSLLLTQF